MTVQLRRLWELNNILSDDGKKTRADLGITNRLSRYWQQRDDRSAKHPHLPPPWLNIRKDAEHVVAGIIVSHRVRKKISGPLHKETTYGDNANMSSNLGKALDTLVKAKRLNQVKVGVYALSASERSTLEAKLAQLG